MVKIVGEQLVLQLILERIIFAPEVRRDVIFLVTHLTQGKVYDLIDDNDVPGNRRVLFETTSKSDYQDQLRTA